MLLKKNLFLVYFSLGLFPLYFLFFNEPLQSQYIFNADFLHLVFFSEALAENGMHAFETWRITPSPYLFPDIFFFSLVNSVIGDNHTSYTLILLLNYVLLNLAIYKLYRFFFNDSLWPVIVYMIAMFIIYLFQDISSVLVANQFIPVNHLSAFIFFGLLLKREIRWSWSLPFWLLAIVLVSFSDPVFILYFLPVQLFYAFRKSHISLVLITFFTAISGFVLFKQVYKIGLFQAENTLPLSFSEGFNSLGNLVNTLVTLSSTSSFLVFSCLLCISIFCVKYKPVQVYSLFYVIWGVPLMACVFGYVRDYATFRYFSGSFYIGTLMGLFVLSQLFSGYKLPVFSNFRKLYAPLVISMCIFYLMLIRISFFQINKPPFVTCIEKYAEEKKLDYIIANYWNAKRLLFFTDKVKVLQSLEEFKPYYHEFNTAWFAEVEQNSTWKGAVFSAGITRDSVTKYCTQPQMGLACGIDSLWVLERYPFSEQ